MFFSALSVLPFGVTRPLNEIAVLSAASAGTSAQITALTPAVINPFQLSPLTLSILLSNAVSNNPIQGLFPLSWNRLVLESLFPGVV